MKDSVDIKDIAKERKKRQRKYRSRKIIGLLLIFLAIFIAAYLNDVLVKKNVPGYLSGVMDSLGGSGFPVSIPDGSVRAIDSVGKNLAVLKDSNLYVYNNKGKQLENIQRMSERTVMHTNKDRVFYYDIGSRDITLHGINSKVFETTMDDNIITGSLGENGEMAVVTWPPNYVAQVKVFREDSEEAFFTYSFSEKLVSNVAVSPKGKQLAIATLSSDGGLLDYNILLYSLENKEEKPESINLENEIVIWMDYYQEDTIAILTDRGYYIFDKSGAHVNSYSFPSSFELVEFRCKQGQVFVMGKDTQTREYQCILLSNLAKELGNTYFDRRPTDIDIGDRYIYILTGNKILQCQNDFTVVESYPVENVERVYFLNGVLYTLTKREIDILDNKATDDVVEEQLREQVE